MECLDRNIDPRSLRHDPLIRREKTILFPVFEPTRTAPPIFLVDIKLALGNNPHLLRMSSWNFHVAYVIRLQYFVAQR